MTNATNDAYVQDFNLARIDARYSYVGDERNTPPVDREWMLKENSDDRTAAIMNQLANTGNGTPYR